MCCIKIRLGSVIDGYIGRACNRQDSAVLYDMKHVVLTAMKLAPVHMQSCHHPKCGPPSFCACYWYVGTSTSSTSQSQHADRLLLSSHYSSPHSTSPSSPQPSHPSQASYGLPRLRYGSVPRIYSRVPRWLLSMAR